MSHPAVADTDQYSTRTLQKRDLTNGATQTAVHVQLPFRPSQRRYCTASVGIQHLLTAGRMHITTQPCMTQAICSCLAS